MYDVDARRQAGSLPSVPATMNRRTCARAAADPAVARTLAQVGAGGGLSRWVAGRWVVVQPRSATAPPPASGDGPGSTAAGGPATLEEWKCASRFQHALLRLPTISRRAASATPASTPVDCRRRLHAVPSVPIGLADGGRRGGRARWPAEALGGAGRVVQTRARADRASTDGIKGPCGRDNGSWR